MFGWLTTVALSFRCSYFGSECQSAVQANLRGDSALASSPQATLSPSFSESEVGPTWGCGLVGNLHGINADGTATAAMQALIDGIKNSSTLKKASYWNWNFVPQKGEGGVPEYLTKDFIFMPNAWGPEPVDAKKLVVAGKASFTDAMGGTSPATMASILLGMNEPDIIGSCMGNMFGSCLAECDDESVQQKDCPVAYLDGHPAAKANSKGQCNCWEYAYATGAGFWSVPGCAAAQPLPILWDKTPESKQCVDTIMDSWKQTAAVARQKGYKYLTTPMVATTVSYARNFIERACGCDASGKCACTDASCGCPVYVVFHFYGNDCQPKKHGNYKTFEGRLHEVAEIMEAYPFVQGAIVNEVGMLNCPAGAICIPNSGDYPADKQPDHGCPSTKELPNGLATFIEEVLDIAMSVKTKDGRYVLKGFSWFNENEAGGTYNLKLQNADGTLNELGKAYIAACTKWAGGTQPPQPPQPSKHQSSLTWLGVCLALVVVVAIAVLLHRSPQFRQIWARGQGQRQQQAELSAPVNAGS